MLPPHSETDICGCLLQATNFQIDHTRVNELFKFLKAHQKNLSGFLVKVKFNPPCAHKICVYTVAHVKYSVLTTVSYGVVVSNLVYRQNRLSFSKVRGVKHCAFTFSWIINF